MSKQKLWGSLFEKEPAQQTLEFLSGRDVQAVPPADEALVSYDIWGSKAHCLMLAKKGIIPKKEAKKIISALKELEELHKDGKFHLASELEDVHTNVEDYLAQKLSIEVAGKLHTGRSRNDQIVLDTRLYLRDQVLSFAENTLILVNTLTKLADKHKTTVMPGFTHHQHAMVTTFGHILLSFASMLVRDGQRFVHWLELYNLNPLGAAAGFGTSLPLDREYTAKLLGFDAVEPNSLDSVTTRWESEADFVFAVTQLMNHLSSFAQTLIIFSMPEFGFIKLSDEYSTGSSMMPQKKNPDSLEVIKGKAGWVQGQLVSLLSIGKSVFMGYNRDSQWTKYLVIDVVRECVYATVLMDGVVKTLKVNKKSMHSWAYKDFITSTDLMEDLISEKRMPMRQAKRIVEGKVAAGELDSLPEPEQAIGTRKVIGGPAPVATQVAAKKISEMASLVSSDIKKYKKKLERASKLMAKEEVKL